MGILNPPISEICGQMGTDSENESEHTSEWSEIEEFLNNPGTRWIRAYRQSSLSEKALILSMMDFGYSVRIERVREIYLSRRDRLGIHQPVLRT